MWTAYRKEIFLVIAIILLTIGMAFAQQPPIINEIGTWYQCDLNHHSPNHCLGIIGTASSAVVGVQSDEPPVPPVKVHGDFWQNQEP